MIQRFLFTAAGRSNVFAYNLVCILKVLTAQCILLLVIAGWQNGLALLPAVPSSNAPVCAAAACVAAICTAKRGCPNALAQQHPQPKSAVYVSLYLDSRS